MSFVDNVIHSAESHRAYFYRVAGAIGAVLVIYGLIDGAKLGEILLAVGTILGVGGNGLAAVNTSTKKDA